MKILLLFLLSLSICFGNNVIYKSNTVTYYCIDNKVKAEVYIAEYGIRIIPVVWINPHQNNETTELKCKNFDEWLKDDDIKK